MKARARVLIVDDRSTARESLQLALDDFQCDFCESDSVTTAIQMIGYREFDVIILDLRLADGNGMDVLRQAERLRLNQTVIVVTGLPDEQTRREALRLGAFDYLVKLDYHELRSTFARLLSAPAGQ